jgi:hypothetical protein
MKNIPNLLGNWLMGVTKKRKSTIRVGACALSWAIWNVQNDYIFSRAKLNSFIQVISLATHWIRTWSLLQQTDKCEEMATGCSRLKSVTRDIFNQSSWCLDLWLACWGIGVIYRVVLFLDFFEGKLSSLLITNIVRDTETIRRLNQPNLASNRKRNS